MIRMLLADDQTMVRSALRLLLVQEPAVQIVGEAADATGLLLIAGEKEKAPDLVLLDWELPSLPVDRLLQLLLHERPSLKVIAMSSRPEAETAAFTAGVHAFISKNEPPDRVLAIVRSLIEKGNDANEVERIS